MAKQRLNHLQTTSCRRAHQTHTTCRLVWDKYLVCRLPWTGRARSMALWPLFLAFLSTDSSNFRICWTWMFCVGCPPLRLVMTFWKRGTSKRRDLQLIVLCLFIWFTINFDHLMVIQIMRIRVNHILHEYPPPFVQDEALCPVWVLDMLRQFVLNVSVVTFDLVIDLSRKVTKER